MQRWLKFLIPATHVLRQTFTDDRLVSLRNSLRAVVGQEDTYSVDLPQQFLREGQVLAIDLPPIDQPAPIILVCEPAVPGPTTQPISEKHPTEHTTDTYQARQ